MDTRRMPKVPGIVLIAAFFLPAGRAARADDESLGCKDTGIYGDLDDQVRLVLPAKLDAAKLSVRGDPRHATPVVPEADRPIKVYPTGGDTELALGPKGRPS